MKMPERSKHKISLGFPDVLVASLMTISNSKTAERNLAPTSCHFPFARHMTCFKACARGEATRRPAVIFDPLTAL